MVEHQEMAMYIAYVLFDRPIFQAFECYGYEQICR
jgi:hypothetical protein